MSANELLSFSTTKSHGNSSLSAEPVANAKAMPCSDESAQSVHSSRSSMSKPGCINRMEYLYAAGRIKRPDDSSSSSEDSSFQEAVPMREAVAHHLVGRVYDRT